MANKITEKTFENLKKEYIYSTVKIGKQIIPKLNNTLIAYRTVDEQGNFIYELDFTKFPNSCTKKYISDCIDINEKDLGYIKRVNWQYLNDDYFTVADIETTGFSPEKGGRIIEIGAVKIDKNGQIVNKFSEFVNPGIKISQKITEITSITNEMVKDSEYIGTVMSKFWEFIRGTTVVFHNAAFDWDRFILYNLSQIGLNLPKNYPCIDTLLLDKELFPNEEVHTLDNMCERLNISVENHHRAISDAEMTAKAFIQLREFSKNKWINLKKTSWNKNKQILNISILSVRFWGKFKKNGTMIKGRQYIKFKCNGYDGDAYYDILEDSWYMKSCKLSFKADELKDSTLKYLNMSMDEFINYRFD